ncbi:MAG TPA: hypothetical protein VMD74_04400 [Candidatus Methylomirabilis sp.]|nr:hypothetical protein [Candidatus Methylomirabilis sp.]
MINELSTRKFFAVNARQRCAETDLKRFSIIHNSLAITQISGDVL